HEDRFVRWAARTAIEHQPADAWVERVFSEKNPAARVEALLALARVGGVCATHRNADAPPVDAALGGRILGALEKIEWSQLNAEGRLAWLRTIEIALHRFEPTNREMNAKLVAKLDPLFPATTREANWLLCETLVYLQSPNVARKALDLM